MGEWNCKPKCTECCSCTVPIPVDLYNKYKERLSHKVEKEVPFPDGDLIVLFSKDTSCVFIEDGKCSIYSERPKICRDYGMSEEIPCAFIKPNGRPRSPAMVKRTQRKINRDVDYAMQKCNVSKDVRKGFR